MYKNYTYTIIHLITASRLNVPTLGQTQNWLLPNKTSESDFQE